MTRFIIPIILLVASVGLFVVYTSPTYQNALAVQTQSAAYNDALTKSNTLQQQSSQLLAKRNTFSATDMAELQEILPDNVDNIRLIIDINNIAARHNLPLKNVVLGTVGGAAQASAAAASASSAIGSVQLGFTVTASYAGFQSFLQDLEHSMRLMDVEQISFRTGATDSNDYAITVQTYWLQ
jgi:hypothetical protein